jgi:hypothetical protein
MFSLHAKVAGCLYKTRAKELLPVAVHRDARGERVIGSDEPLGQSETVVRRSFQGRRDPLGHAGLYFISLERVLAALEDMGLAGFFALFHHEGGWNGFV